MQALTPRFDTLAWQVSFKEAGGTGPLAFVGLPFVLAAVLDLCTAQIAVPLAWKCLGFEPTWDQSGAPLEDMQARHDCHRTTAREQIPMIQYYASKVASKDGKLVDEPNMVQVYLDVRLRKIRTENGDSGEQSMVAYYTAVGKEPELAEAYCAR